MVTPSDFPIAQARAQFPALCTSDEGRSRIYLDNPAGSQIPHSVAAAAAECLINRNANLGGFFKTSTLAEQVVAGARSAMAVFLGAPSDNEIIFGPSMTALTFQISRSIAQTLRSGDEIIVTRMDHDANIAPWLAIARERNLIVRWIPFNAGSWTIGPDALESMLTNRTRLVALTYASNVTGTINPLQEITSKIRAAGAMSFIDAVQYAPHRLIDVEALGCDFLVCSAYKFYGPHLGVLWGRGQVLKSLPAYKVRPAKDRMPWRFENGTPQIELLAALEACVRHFQSIGETGGSGESPRLCIQRAFEAITEWEGSLTWRLIDGLRHISGIRIIGIADESRRSERLPTVSFICSSRSSEHIVRMLAERDIFAWNGYNYSLETVRALGLDEDDGVVRLGMAYYNTPDEIDTAVQAIREICA